MINFFGQLHFIFLHFPIAFITLAVISEILFKWQKNPLFDNAARVSIMAAALFAIPTVLCGLALIYYHPPIFIDEPLWWHRFFGGATLITAILATTFKELNARNIYATHALYNISLALAFICMSITGYLGGLMTFGPLT